MSLFAVLAKNRGHCAPHEVLYHTEHIVAHWGGSNPSQEGGQEGGMT